MAPRWRLRGVAARRGAAAEQDQAGRPVALALVRGQQVQHCLVVGVPGARQGVADDAGQVEVADGDRVRVAVARWIVSAAVHRPMPGISSSRAAASAGSIVAASSSRRATRAARRIVAERLASTPARCHSQDGISAQVRGVRHHVQAGVGGRAGGGVPYSVRAAARRGTPRRW